MTETEKKESKPARVARVPIIGCDFGYGLTKVYNGTEDPLGIRSLVGDPVGTIKFTTKEEDIGKKDLNWISIKFPLTDDRFYIGDLARRQSEHVFYITDKDKLSYSSTKSLIDAGIAMLLPESVKGKPVPVALNVVTGLPVSYYTPPQIKIMKDTMSGEHSIDFDWDRDGSYAHRYKFDIKNIHVIPQPVGTFFNLLLDEKGEFREDMQSMASSTVAIIDVGYGTSDFCILKGSEYIEKSSRSTQTAMNSVYAHIAKTLSDKSGEDVQPWDIETVILKGDKDLPIKVRGVNYNLEALYHKALDVIAEELVAIAKGLWRTEHQVDMYILTGGGAFVFAERFRAKFGAKGNIITTDNPVYSNVIGYHKLGLRRFK